MCRVSLPWTSVAFVMAVIALMGLISQPASAQLLYGTLVGNVTDSSAAAVAGATVTISDPSTGFSRQATTTDRGEYVFTNLPVGTYTVTISGTGFKQLVRNQVNVQPNVTVRVDGTLELGIVSEKVEVQAEATALQTDRAETRGAVQAIQYLDLPVAPNRSYESLLNTIPGLSPSTGFAAIENTPSMAQAFTINDQGGTGRSTRIDGAAEINMWLSGEVAYIPSLEAIDTVSVTTSSFSAELGGAAGGAVNLTIKSGSNTTHGSLFEEHSDAALLANPNTLPAGFPKPALTFNQFGGSVGGKVIRDKLFYFLSFDGTFSRRTGSTPAAGTGGTSTAFYTVPDALQRQGILTGSPTPIYDPSTGNPNGTGRTPFPGNKIPGSDINPIMFNLVNKLPLPNLPGLTNNYFIETPINRDVFITDAKINWNPTQKAQLWARMGLVGDQGFTGNAFDAEGIGGPIEGGNIWGKTFSTTFAGVYSFTSHLLLDANIGWTELTTNIEQVGIGTNLGLNAGIPGTNGPARYQSGWPEFIPDTYSQFGTNAQWMPWNRWDPQYNYSPNMTWIKGSHQIRFGGELVYQTLNHIQAEYTSGGTAYGAQGGFAFGGQLTTLNGGPGPNQFNSMAAMLLGDASIIGKNLINTPSGVLTTRQKFYSLYIQDQYQVSSKLTVNLGVRWEYYPMIYREDRGVETYNFSNNTMNLCGYPGSSIPQDCGVNMSKKDFGPRAGIAYRVTPSFVIRSGYSLAFDPTPLTRQFRGNYPELISYLIQSGSASPSGYVPVGNISQGIPALPVPALGNGVVPVPATVSIATVLPNFHRGYIQSWNFTLEKQVLQNLTATAAYVGNQVNGIMTSLNVNAGNVGCQTACVPEYAQFGRIAQTNVVEPLGNSHYEALQAGLKQRFSQGLTFGAAYTWGKNMAQNTGYALPQYGYLYYGPTADPPWFFNLNGSYELPFGRGKALVSGDNLASKILGGWQVNGVYVIIAGGKFGITSSSPLNAVNGPTQRANVVGPVTILGGLGPGNEYFSATSFAPGPANVIGNAGPNILQGPTEFNLDASLFRNFSVTERIKLQFRAEAFNVSNTPAWGNPGNNASNLVLNADGSVKNLNGFGIITGTRGVGRDVGDQRQMQLGLRLSF